MNQANMKAIVRGAYDLQKIRIQMGNRISINFKAKLGQKPGEKESDLKNDAKVILNDLRRRYKRITDGITVTKRNFSGDGVIDSYTEFCLMSQYVDLLASEERHFRNLGHVLQDYPIFTDFFEGVKGVGPAMAGVIISEIDITKAQYPSSLWAYAGLDVAADGAGRSKRKEHLVDIEYEDKDGKQAIKKGITFNPFLKTKLVGVLGPSFLKQGPEGYADIYYGYKHRLECHPAHQEKSKGHRHNMAIRYMIKMFLIDLHGVWRAIEGLSVPAPYHKAKLELEHRSAA